MMRNLVSALVLPALLAAAAPRPLANAEGSVSGLRLEGRGGRTELTVEITGAVEFNHFRLGSPARVVVDIQNARSALPASRYDGIHRGGVAGVRTSQHAPDVVRVVLDLEQEADYRVERVGEGLRISLATGATEFAAWSSGPGGSAPVADMAEAPRTAERYTTSTRISSPPQQRTQRARPITVTFENTTMSDVLATFAELTGRSIIPGAEVGAIEVSTVSIVNQPWDEALRELLLAYGLAMEETASGIIRVDRLEDVAAREQNVQLETVTFRVNYVPVAELQATLTPLASERGSVSINQTTNTLIATDVPSVIRDFERLVRQLDVRTPQVTIQAKIVFINRTATEELGVTYDLKDSRGNQLNQLNPGFDPSTGEEVPRGTDLVQLGGNSIAALGNANQRVQGASLQTMISLILGRYTLITFLDALQSAELSDVQAAPVVTTSSNHQAEIWVGERTPIRVIDLGGASAGGQGGGGGGQAGGVNAPRATAQLVETGIRLRVTPQVTSDRRVLLTLHAERSSAQAAATEIGVNFQQQQGDTRVMVRDGETAVIAGLTVTEVTNNRTGIPFLMDVPYLGSLFRRTRNQEIKRDLLIMVTPHLVEES
jgi:type IV pilus assembly protein PilQ